jgi:hypothetical protein
MIGQGNYNMKTLGRQLTANQYESFRAEMAAEMPGQRIQTVNACGKFCVNGATAEQLQRITAIYERHAATHDTGFSMLIHQATERRRSQTHNARAKRSAMAMRFGR